MADKTPSFSISDRFEHGNFEIGEVCELAKVGKTRIYEDLKKGRLSIRKIGRKSVVPGPIALAYVTGLSCGEESAA